MTCDKAWWSESAPKGSRVDTMENVLITVAIRHEDVCWAYTK